MYRRETRDDQSFGDADPPENPASRQAESARFRQRGCLACDPRDSPSPAGLRPER